MKKNLNVLSLNSNKKDNALQNLQDTDNAEIGRKCTNLMHVLEYNNVWKLTRNHLTQILLQKRTCCPAVGNTVSKLYLSTPAGSASAAESHLPILRPCPHLITGWRRGLTAQPNVENPTQCYTQRLYSDGQYLLQSSPSSWLRLIESASQFGFTFCFNSASSHLTLQTSSQCMNQENPICDTITKKWGKVQHTKPMKVIEENNKNMTRNYWWKQAFYRDDQQSF